MKIPVANLTPGMKTSDWEVLGHTFKRDDAPGETLVRMRHRVDGGVTIVAYPDDSEIEVVDENS